MPDVKDLNTLQRFAVDTMQKVSLFKTPRMVCDLYCLEAGQSQKAHSHGEADKVYVVLEGRGEIQIGADRFELGPQQAVIAPSGSDHGVTNPGPARLVLCVFMAPAPTGDGRPKTAGHGHSHDAEHGHRH